MGWLDAAGAFAANVGSTVVSVATAPFAAAYQAGQQVSPFVTSSQPTTVSGQQYVSAPTQQLSLGGIASPQSYVEQAQSIISPAIPTIQNTLLAAPFVLNPITAPVIVGTMAAGAIGIKSPLATPSIPSYQGADLGGIPITIQRPVSAPALTAYDTQALQAVQGRAGYTPTSELGGASTQRILEGYKLAQQNIALMGGNVAPVEMQAGRVLEAQRAASTTTREQQFYSGELSKWAENMVELGSAYHVVGKASTTPIPANRYEYQADLAVEFLKGAPTKSSEYFSPVSGEMATYLPSGKGVQQISWDVAKTGEVSKVSFAPAVEKLVASQSVYGPYGALWGGPEYKETGTNVKQYAAPTPEFQVKGYAAQPSVDLTNLPTPFISSIGGAQPTKYEYRTDPLAVALEGVVFFGDKLTMGLWTPGKELLASKGQGDNPTLAAADATLAQYTARQPEIAALGTSIETQRSTIDAMLVGKTNAEGKFIGTAEEYTKYTGALTKLNEDVATYNKFNTDYSNAWGKAVASGAYIKTDKGYVANPDLEHPYGAFSDWSRSITQTLRGGTTEADIIRYESSPAYKESGFAMQFGESSWKAITNPTELSTMALHGVEFYAGIGALGAGVGMVAAPAAAEGGVGAGLLSRGALGLQTIFQNPYVQGGIATAFTSQAYYEGTEKLTNLPAAGGTTINMAAMLAGGFAPEGAAALGDYSAVRFAIKPETQIRVQPVESGSVMPSESGASGLISFEAPYQISQLPRYNVLGYEVMFPRLSNLREVETGTIHSTQPIEIENIQSFVAERNLGASPAAQIWSRESNIVIDFFRGRPLGKVTTETNIGALSTTRAASVFYDEAITQSRGLGRTPQEIQDIATGLALRDLEIAEPVTAYRNYGTYVARGESLPNLINEALTVRITPDATATQYTVGRTNPFDYITRVSASRIGTNARENYNTWVERLPGGTDTGILSTTMTRERAIVNDLFRESTGTVPRTTEFITVYDKYGNPVFREEGGAHSVSAAGARNVADYMISQGGEASIAHYHPNVGFSFRELGASIGRDIWDRLILQRELLEPTTTEAYIRSKRAGSMYYETPSEGDIAIAVGNTEGIAAEFIANRQGVFMYGKPQSGWGSLSGLEGMRDDALARYYFGGERGPLTNLGYDLISGLQVDARVEYTPHRQVYFEGERTTAITEDVSGAIKGNLPSFMQRGISEAMDRIALNDQRLEFETTNLYHPVRQYAGYGGGLQYGAAQIAISGREAAVGVTTEKMGSLQGDILSAGKETKIGTTIKAYDIGSDIRPQETSRGSSFGIPIVGAPGSIQTSRLVIGVVPALATETLRAYSLGSDIRSRFDTAQKTDMLMAYTLVSPQVSTRARQDSSYDRILESASKFDMITVPKQRQSFIQEITPLQYQKQTQNPWIDTPYKPSPPPPPIPILPLLPSFSPSLMGGGSPRGFKKFTEYMSFGGLGWKGKMSVGTNARRIGKLKSRKKK